MSKNAKFSVKIVNRLIFESNHPNQSVDFQIRYNKFRKEEVVSRILQKRGYSHWAGLKLRHTILLSHPNDELTLQIVLPKGFQ